MESVQMAMAERGFNKTDLAKEMNVTRETLYTYFSGTTIKPKPASRIAEALRVPAHSILIQEDTAV